MKKSPRFSSLLKNGVPAKVGYAAWHSGMKEARKVAVAEGKAASKTARAAGKAAGKKIGKRVPVLGVVFIVSDIQEKGFVGGVCNSLLDACPGLGWGKLAAECIFGDWIPDKED